MDAFFAAIEQRDNPKYRNKPLIVGGKPGSRGVVAAASYEVRKYGVHSAMPATQAYKLCPQAIFVPPRFEVYKAVSQQIRAIMLALTPLVEPLSLDEAYLDVTNVSAYKGSATLMAKALLQRITKETRLSASAGVSYNKMLAKIASDLNKPNGIAVITPEQAADFIASLPIEKFHGIGKATATRMKTLGIHYGRQLRKMDLAILQDHFGKPGLFYHQIAHGNDPRTVNPHRSHKSIGSETTFSQDLTAFTDIYQALLKQNNAAFYDLTKKSLQARTITIKIKFSNFHQLTRTKTLDSIFTCADDAHYWIRFLLNQIVFDLPVRLVGVTYSTLSTIKNVPTLQRSLF